MRRGNIASLISGSTNGTFVNNATSQGGVLRDGDYLRVGNCLYRFLSGGNIEAEYHEEIYRLTVLDGLTQVHNRRYLNDFIEREVVRAAHHNRPLALVLVDIDHFKMVNDKLGHLAGDLVLRELCAAFDPWSALMSSSRVTAARSLPSCFRKRPPRPHERRRRESDMPWRPDRL